jgi:hypothetical protein
MRQVLCLVGPTGLAMLVMAVAFLDSSARKNRRYKLLAERYQRLYELYERRKAADKPVPASPPEDDDNKAIRDYAAVAKQYKAMVDELYDYGEQVAKRRRDPA